MKEDVMSPEQPQYYPYEETPDKYTHISDGNESLQEDRNVPPAQTSDRDGYWKKPTEEEIAANPDLAKQLKYYT